MMTYYKCIFKENYT